MCTGEEALKKACIEEQVGVVTCRSPKIEGSRGFLVEQRAKRRAELCHRFENTRKRLLLSRMLA